MLELLEAHRDVIALDLPASATHRRCGPRRPTSQWRSPSARAPARLPEARRVDLPGCGHVPFSDDPELVARVLLDGSGGA